MARHVLSLYGRVGAGAVCGVRGGEHEERTLGRSPQTGREVDAGRRFEPGPRVSGGRRRAALYRFRGGPAHPRPRRQLFFRLRDELGTLDPRPRPSEGARGSAGGPRRRLLVRRADGAGNPTCRAHHPRDARRRTGAVRQFRNRGDDERGAAGPRRHRPPGHRQVRGRLSRPRRRPPGPGGLRGNDLRHALQPGGPGRGRPAHLPRSCGTWRTGRGRFSCSTKS